LIARAARRTSGGEGREVRWIVAMGGDRPVPRGLHRPDVGEAVD
jgi:hypothetical protein